MEKWEDCFDCPARTTSKELAPIHSVKSGIHQNTCSTRPRVVADFGESALMRIARLMDSLAKGLKRMATKSAAAMLKKNEYHHRTGRLVVNVYSSNTRQLGCVFSRYGAAEVFTDLTEELRHAETDPTCKIHKGYCTSYQNSRP